MKKSSAKNESPSANPNPGPQVKPEVGRNRVERAESWDAALVLNAISDRVISVDRNGKIKFANQAAIDSMDRPLLATSFLELTGDLGIEICEEDIERAMNANEPVEFEARRNAHGTWFEVKTHPVCGGLVVVIRDVTGRKCQESSDSSAEVLRLNENLNQRVRERTADLEAANSELEGFTYSVSHDLRAPLRAIISTSMMLLEDTKGILNDATRALLVRQAAAAKKVGCLIDELLKLSRITRQNLVFQTLDLGLIAADVVQELKDDARAKDIVFEIQRGLEATGDARLMRLVLLNLIENACKFSPSQGHVTVGKEEVGFFVRDEGIGFEMTYADKLFQPFERLVNESQYPGTGIGLANVQRIVHRHGGRVWAESEPGRGATFYFTLA